MGNKSVYKKRLKILERLIQFKKMLFHVIISFMIMKVSIASKPIVIAHRGASGHLPEHTLESKTAALVMGSDYIEQDVVLTRDNIPLVLHDIFLDTVTNVAEKFPDRFRMHKGEKRYFAIDFDIGEIKSLEVFFINQEN